MQGSTATFWLGRVVWQSPLCYCNVVIATATMTKPNNVRLINTAVEFNSVWTTSALIYSKCRFKSTLRSEIDNRLFTSCWIHRGKMEVENSGLNCGKQFWYRKRDKNVYAFNEKRDLVLKKKIFLRHWWRFFCVIFFACIFPRYQIGFITSCIILMKFGRFVLMNFNSKRNQV